MSTTMENLTIFRAYDVRGIYGSDITLETMTNIARAFGTFMKQKSMDRITVGGDIRASTGTLLHAFISGLTSTGVSCDVVTTSPLGITLFNSFSKNYAASAFITASHLPPEWNGVKFYWGVGIGFSPEENEEVKKIFIEKQFTTADVFELGKVRFVDPYYDFVEYLRSKFAFSEEFKIAIDCGNGATSVILPQLYKDLGFEVISIFDTPDPKFPNRPSEPNEESLKKLSEFVSQNQVTFAAGFDGDGDRCVFADEKGKVISADAFGIITARYLTKELDNNRVIINMECSLAMEKYLEDMNAEVKRIRVGHSFLSMEAKKMDAVMGVEASGHAIVPSVFLFDDALILPLVFAKAIENSEKQVSELVAEIKLPIKKRYDLPCSDETKFHKMKDVDALLRTEEGKIADVDGTSLTTPYGRILARVSNTSPKLRVTIESLSQEGYDKLEDKFLQKIKDLIK